MIEQTLLFEAKSGHERFRVQAQGRRVELAILDWNTCQEWCLSGKDAKELHSALGEWLKARSMLDE